MGWLLCAGNEAVTEVKIHSKGVFNMIEISIWAFVAAMGIPSAITGFCFWALQKRITKRDAAHDAREAAREKNETLIIKGMGAAIALAEATAKAVQRIPDAHCNGDMHSALEYAQKVKHEHKEFMAEQSVHALY